MLDIERHGAPSCHLLDTYALNGAEITNGSKLIKNYS